ncbi:maleylpyruvate isomerase N-terminal domain-containing protein [Kitasatospora sp. MAP5-34]|uniref:maleylpyruvate isomerase N-terminal domain-containing protein n=1 Tax=Kitasatospora sp. MAP5-34 TaxID=3035102 RepID=UPI0024750D53|nr:maleylpyruvate isomerase N-terminal domain-containing protein [Kitasatospora sp. MAP5-34]MDH6577890.1 uncharacterized protein (TIGR03083 family) [Kitasatospora sp. MAP5-34]
MEQSDREQARRAVGEGGARLVRLLREGDPAAQVAGSQWRVADVASHLAYVFRGFTEAAVGNSAQFARYVPDEPDFHRRLATVNGALVQELADSAGDQQSAVAIGMVEEGIAGFLAATASLDPEAALDTPWYGPGVTRTTDTLTALALGEILVHGLDIARTSATPWPIERSEATVVAREVFARMLPLMLTDAGRRAEVSYRISWRGAPRSSPDLVVRLSAGTVTTGPAGPGERVDCRVLADPVAFLLVGYGRSSTWREVLAGRILAWGRRPWAAARLPQLFCRP